MCLVWYVIGLTHISMRSSPVFAVIMSFMYVQTDTMPLPMHSDAHDSMQA